MLESLVWILVVHDLRQRIFYLGGVFEVWFLVESFHKVVDFGGLTIMVHHVRRRTRRSHYLLGEIIAMETCRGVILSTWILWFRFLCGLSMATAFYTWAGFQSYFADCLACDTVCLINRKQLHFVHWGVKSSYGVLTWFCISWTVWPPLKLKSNPTFKGDGC